MSEKVKIEKEEFGNLINEINTLLQEQYLLKFIEATVVVDDNSNLYQTAELRTPRSSKEWYRFVKFLWISEKPYRFGIALYERI